MPFTDLVPSQHLQIFSYEDIDHFRHGIRDANVDIVPLANFNGDLGQAVLSLPGCTVYLLRTFPRIVRSALEGAGTFFLFSLRRAVRHFQRQGTGALLLYIRARSGGVPRGGRGTRLLCRDRIPCADG